MISDTIARHGGRKESTSREYTPHMFASADVFALCSLYIHGLFNKFTDCYEGLPLCVEKHLLEHMCYYMLQRTRIVYKQLYIHICLYVLYIYIYIYREREIDR